MPNISKFAQEGLYLNYTPVTAKYAGNVVNLGNMAGFTPRDIDAAALGQAMVSGVIKVPATATLGNIGDNVWWDANGTQAITGGTTDGACSTNASACQAAADFWLGTLTKALTIADGWAYVAINKANLNLPAWTGKTHLLVTGATSLVVATHGGGVVHVTGNTVITLPNGVAGMEYIIQKDDVDGLTLIQVDPLHATERIEGANLTIAVTYLALNTALDSKRGDYLHLRCDVPTVSWCALAKRGIWVTSV